MRGVELRHLRYFVAVAEELHFTRAAARLRTAQPGLSKQIRRLEAELGVELFRRTNHSVELTDAGRLFLEQSRRVLDEADRARRVAQQAAQGDIGHLSVGFVPDTMGELLPEILIAYRTKHPNVDITLHQLGRNELIAGLLDNHIQLGLLIGSYQEPQLRFMSLQRQPLLIAMPAQHRFAGKKSLCLHELAGERWIDGVIQSGPLHAACAKAGFQPLIAQQISGREARLALVASGVGLATSPSLVSHHFSRHVVYKPLDPPELTFDVTMAWHKNRKSPVVSGFLAIARATIPPTLDPTR